MGQIEDAAAERLGEPVSAATIILPVGGWNSGAWGQLAKGLFARLRGQPRPTVSLDRYNVLAVTPSRVTCFSSGFARGEGLVLRDQLADLPREGLALEAKRMEAVTASYDPGMGQTTRTQSKWIHRISLSAGGERLDGDLADDGAGRRVMKELKRRD
jgi:hypothetical protein